MDNKRRVEVAALAAVGVLLWWSANQLRSWAREQKPLEITCADFVRPQTRPQARWLRLTHCAPDFAHITVDQKDRAGHWKAEHVYIPFRSEGSTVPAIVVLERHDAKLLALANAGEEALHHFTMGDPPAVDPAMQSVADELQHPLQGLVTQLDGKTRDEMMNMSLGIDSTFVLLEAGGKPSPNAGIAGVFFGVIAAGFLVFDLVRRRGAGAPARRRTHLSLSLT